MRTCRYSTPGRRPAGAGPPDPHRSRGEDGFTLVEMVMVIAIAPLVIGVIALALIAVTDNESAVSTKLADSSDAQVLSAFFVRDVQSASLVTTDATPTAPAACGSGTTAIVSLAWPSTPTYEVTYWRSAPITTNATTHALVTRDFCTVSGGTPTPAASDIVAHDFPATGTLTQTFTGWVSTLNVTSISINAVAPGSSFQYQASGVPRTAGGGSSGPTSITVPFLVLDTACEPVLTMSSGSTRLYLSPNHTAGVMAVNSTCPSTVALSGGSSIVGADIVTANSSLTSVTTTGSSKAPPQVYATGGISDPWASTPAPQWNTSALPAVCIPDPLTSTYTCPAGEYVTNSTVFAPGGSNGYALNFTGGVGTTTIIDQPLTVTNASFGAGTYWFEGGFTNTGSTTFGGGTYIFGTSTTATTMLTQTSGSASMSGSGFFYLPDGNVDMSGGGTALLAPLGPPNTYAGLLIWAVKGSMNLSGGSSATSFGGAIYAPAGNVHLSGGSSLSLKSVDAFTATLDGGAIVTVG